MVTVLAGATALLGTLVVVANAPTAPKAFNASEPYPDGDLADGSAIATLGQLRTVTQLDSHLDYFRRYSPFLDPVPLGQDVNMTANLRYAARVRVVRGDGVASYRVRIQNAGTKPINGSIASYCAWLETGDGRRVSPPQVRVLTISSAPPSRIEPGAELHVLLTFEVPARARPAVLTLCLKVGEYQPNARWTLTS